MPFFSTLKLSSFKLLLFTPKMLTVTCRVFFSLIFVFGSKSIGFSDCHSIPWGFSVVISWFVVVVVLVITEVENTVGIARVVVTGGIRVVAGGIRVVAGGIRVVVIAGGD